jgi:hypothetical protein
MHVMLKSYRSILPPLRVLLPEHPQTEHIWERLPSFPMTYGVLRVLEGRYEELGCCHMKKPAVRDLHSEYICHLIFLDTKMSILTSNKLINNFKCFHSSSVSFSESIFARLWRSGTSRAIS